MPFLEFIRWQDVIDILLNSYILFRLYVLFKETYVFRVLTGIAFLWIFQRIAVFWQLSHSLSLLCSEMKYGVFFRQKI